MELATSASIRPTEPDVLAGQLWLVVSQMCPGTAAADADYVRVFAEQHDRVSIGTTDRVIDEPLLEGQTAIVIDQPHQMGSDARRGTTVCESVSRELGWHRANLLQ
jgi:hypothetical protein